MPLLFLESVGTTELLIILVVALIVFGPRKLPELGRTLGRSLGEFKRASDDLKRTWEQEVETERLNVESQISRAALAEASAEGQPSVVEVEGLAAGALVQGGNATA